MAIRINNVTVIDDNRDWTGNTIPISAGGTGANTAPDARTSLGLGTIATRDAPTGNVVGTTDSQTLTNKTIVGLEANGEIYANGSVRGNIVTVPALDIDCANGNYFIKTINTSSSFTFSNAPASRSYAFTLEVIHTSGTITWPSTVRWSNNTAPSLTTNNTHLFTFVTDDGGTIWRGVSNINYPTT